MSDTARKHFTEMTLDEAREAIASGDPKWRADFLAWLNEVEADREKHIFTDAELHGLLHSEWR